MMLAVVSVTFAVILYSLRVRRTTWGSSWETDATVCVALQGCGVALMSPWADQTANERVHRIVGIWNLQDLFGHLCMLVAVSALIHHVLTRLVDDTELTSLFMHRVVGPLKLVIPVLVMLFVLADSGRRPEFLAAPVQSVWEGLYWLLLLGIAMYLLTYSVQLLLHARQDERSRPTVDIYLGAIAFDIVGCGIQFGAMWLRADHTATTLIVWWCLCAGAAAFAYGAARSWRAKIDWFGTDPESLHPPAAS